MSHVALALTDAAATGLATGDPATLAALDEAHAAGIADLLILGADALLHRDPTDAATLGQPDAEPPELPGALPGTGTRSRERGPEPVVRALDPVAVAVARHARFPRWGFLAVATPTRDHPYNLARRVLGAWHLTGGRLGVILADDDPGLPLEHGDAIPWLPGIAPGAEVTAETADALRTLWNTWPAGTIVGDRQRGVYARVDGVRRAEHAGRYRIAGPLGTPALDRGEPVLGAWEPRGDAGWAELVVRDDVFETGGAGGGETGVADAGEPGTGVADDGEPGTGVADAGEPGTGVADAGEPGTDRAGSTGAGTSGTAAAGGATDRTGTIGTGAGRIGNGTDRIAAGTSGATIGRIITVSTVSEIPRGAHPAAVPDAGPPSPGLREVLGLPPRTRDLAGHTPHLKEERS